MAWRKYVLVVGVLALSASVLIPCLAEPEPHAKAQVFSRKTADGARLVFEWDSREKVPFTIERHGDQIVLHFEKPVALRWGSSLKAVSPYVKQVEASNGGETLTLTLDHPSKAHYLGMLGIRSGENDKNGIDLAETRVPSEPRTTLASPPAAPQKLTKHIERKIEKKPVVTAQAIVHTAPPPAITPPAEMHHTTEVAATEGESTETAAVEPVQATPAPDIAKLAQLSPAAGAEPTPAPATAAAVVIPEKVTFLLPYKDDEFFAAFVWKKRLWIVSENSAPVPPDEIREAGGALIKEVGTVSDPHATITYVSLAADVSAAIEKVPPDRVQVLLKHANLKPAQAFTISLNTAAKGQTSMTIPAAKASQVIAFRDPLTGRPLSVVPVNDPGAGIALGRSFVQFNLIKSAQGVAVESSSDALTVAAQKGAVTVSATDGLDISSEIAEQLQEAESETALSKLPPTLFPYVRWKLDDEKNWVPTQLRLFHDIAFGTGEAANKARLKLLGYYLGQGLFPEAQGMANDILRSSLKFYKANKVAALRGASYLFMYRISEAERDFAAPELKDDPEARIWLTLCKELLGEGKETFDFSANYDRYISHYPPVFIGKLAVIAADRSINRKEYDAANTIFETLKRDNYDEQVKKYIDYMHGKVLAETHNEAEAAKIWEEQARNVEDPLIRSRAEFSLVNLLLRSDKISHEDAIKRLEKLRIVWRGDSLELSVLTLLSNLYLQDKIYDKALHTMRDIVLYYPQVPETVTTARQMEDTFITLYNKGAADKMPPLEALSLFYEFRDLVPIGKTGDLMIRNLAERLVNIDLLDRAALLLEHQIHNRLQGEERSRVGAHLAQIYLLNHQSKEALDTLKTTGYGDLPADLQLERLRLTARALAQQGKEDKAIEVLSTDTSAEGSLLRLTIYWDNRDWSNVVVAAEDILGNRNDPSAPLTGQESDVLLKLATAYVYEHDSGQLQYLRDYFTPLMKNNARRDSFLFITSESGTIDYDNITSLDQDINTVKSFLAHSQDKPGKNGLSKAVN